MPRKRDANIRETISEGIRHIGAILHVYDAHWVCTGLHPRPDAATPARRATAGGCEKLFREKLSGTRTTLPAREKLLAFARKGDVVVVWKLDRLGRSLRDLIDVVNSLQDRGVGLRSLQEAIDTTTPAGKLTFHIFAALAEFERDMIGERTRAGLAAAHKRGVAIGRPRALTPEQILMAKAMTADPAISTRQVAEQFGIHRSTLYRHLNARQKRSA